MGKTRQMGQFSPRNWQIAADVQCPRDSCCRIARGMPLENSICAVPCVVVAGWFRASDALSAGWCNPQITTRSIQERPGVASPARQSGPGLSTCQTPQRIRFARIVHLLYNATRTTFLHFPLIGYRHVDGIFCAFVHFGRSSGLAPKYHFSGRLQALPDVPATKVTFG
jgi:hypothetical protein